MPRILLPNGATREVPFLNPGDVPVGSPSILDAGGTDLGETGGQISTAQVQNVGADEDAPAIAGASPVIRMRRTTQSNPAPSQSRSSSASPVRVRPGSMSPIPGARPSALDELEARLAGSGTALDKIEKKLSSF